MEMAEIPKLDLSSSSYEDLISEEKNRGSAFRYSAEKGDSFVIDMDAFSSANQKDPTNANSKITSQRSLSRKGSLRLGDRKVKSSATLYEKDTVPTICPPKGTLVGPCTLEKTAGMALGSMDHSINPLVYQQITMTTNNIVGNPTENKCSITRRNSFRRPSSWALDPKRVLLFFATVSSMGTMLLIYFILSSSKQSPDEYGGDWKQ
ncbi:hypothetical protein LR48_Vigan303s002800 [Vigna angularis]|uniref:Uncharacterized protein n=2 Tax=Phaseolus angularis TaxID=3914 RepID=A0A0L9T8C8_PHAAN|nr:hypothetical protein LR48_Vigan303s002800 [Vigna angularis]BAU00817.1 hypothetical protein VIGAN_10244900 [Vigna angularis var. angularis]